MKLPAEERPALTASTDLAAVSRRIRRTASPFLPQEAIVLDEDVNAKSLVRELRRRRITYEDGRPGLEKFDGLQIVAAGHLFDSTEDGPLLEWCTLNDYPLVTANEQDFLQLHRVMSHAGILIVRDKPGLTTRTGSYADEFQRIFDNLSRQELRDELVLVVD